MRCLPAAERAAVEVNGNLFRPHGVRGHFREVLRCDLL
jgi:hypothetical protein